MSDLTKFYRQASWHLAVLNWGLFLSLMLNYEQNLEFGTEIEFSIPEQLISLHFKRNMKSHCQWNSAGISHQKASRLLKLSLNFPCPHVRNLFL